MSDRPVALLPASDRTSTDAEAPGDPSGRSVQSETNVRPAVADDTPCDHTDSYGSMVMEGGPVSRYPGRLMCIGCDARFPFLTVVPER